MKTSNKILVGIMSVLVLSMLTFFISARSSLNLDFQGQGMSPSEVVAGDAQITKEQKVVTDFSEIGIRGEVDLYITKGPTSVEVEIDKNLSPYFMVEVNGGKLELGLKNNVRARPSQRIKVFVSMESLTGISQSGNTVIEMRDTFDVTSFAMNVSGSTESYLNLRGEEVSVKCSGSGYVVLSGSAEQLHLGASGSATIEAQDLDAKAVNVSSSGSVDLSVSVSDLLEIKSSGSAEIKYKGRPVINQSSSGGLRIKQL